MDHSRFVSPFAWRYGSEEMRWLWSERCKRRLWRRIWTEIARAQAAAGLVRPEQVAELEAHIDTVDIVRAEAIEAEIHHDLMAEVRAYAEQCPSGGAIIHLGATSADIEDNADALRLRDSLDLLLIRLQRVLGRFATLILDHADHPTMAFTHLQPAEPTTVGYRLALHAQDLHDDLHTLTQLRENTRGKGLKGAVGTGAAYAELLRDTPISASEFEARVMDALALPAYPVTGQTYPRRQDSVILNGLAGLAGSLYRFAFDLRLLQSPMIGEWHEGFGRRQVGSSAMPFKRNPILSEKIDSLARYVAGLAHTAWENAAHSLLERTLDDSANRREILPTAFLACDELLITAERVLSQLIIDPAATQRNLTTYGPFAATERVLMAAARAGADRQAIHEHLRELSMQAWTAISSAAPNPLADLVAASTTLAPFLSESERRTLMDAAGHVGDAPARARAFAQQLVQELEQPDHATRTLERIRQDRSLSARFSAD